jgi:hypothetical protein
MGDEYESRARKKGRGEKDWLKPFSETKHKGFVEWWLCSVD